MAFGITCPNARFSADECSKGPELDYDYEHEHEIGPAQGLTVNGNELSGRSDAVLIRPAPAGLLHQRRFVTEINFPE
ncbi:MAG: hypothetical protein P8X85_23420 [Desulfobacterales bacterium]|jgi:hypothetical protein